jgi:hypothetical protein
VFNDGALLGTQTLPLTLKLQIRDDSTFAIWYSDNAVGSETFAFDAH